MTEVLAPTMIDYAAPELAAAMVPRLLRGDETWCQGFSEPDTGQQPGRAGLPGRRAPTTVGGSPARRSGPAWPSTPSAASCSPAPAHPSRPTGASPPCSWTWTPPGSRCDRSAPCTAARSSASSSSTTWSSPSTAPWATEGGGWAVAMDLLPYERSTSLWHRAAFLHRRLQQLLEAAPPGALDPARLGEVTQLLYAFRARSRATQHRHGRAATTSVRRRRSTRCCWPPPSRRCSTWSPTAWPPR